MLKRRGRPKKSDKNPFAGYRGRPKKEVKNIQVCISMPFKLEQAIEKIARKKHKPFSATFRELLSEALNIKNI